MKVSRLQIISRGLHHRCPNCGSDTLFEPGRYFEVKPVCPDCGMLRTKDEAAFLGSTTINYGVTVFGLVLPGVLIASLTGAPVWQITTGAGVAAVGIPLLLYRPSKSWWLMTYYLTFPNHLPVNWPERAAGELPPDE